MGTPHRTQNRKTNRPVVLIFGGALLGAGAFLAYALAGENDRQSLIEVERGDRVQGLDARMRTGVRAEERPAPPARMRAAAADQPPPQSDGLVDELAAILAAERSRAADAEQARLAALLEQLRADRQDADARLAEMARAQANAQARFDRQLEASLEAERERHRLRLAALEAERAADQEAALRAARQREAAAQDAAEREAAARARRALEARLSSKAVLVDDGVIAAAEGGGGVEPRSGRRLSANEQFLADAYSPSFPMSRAGMLRQQDRLVAQGTIIQATLETALSSELPGMIRAVVSENVWSFDGSRIVIPQGSRLIGRYSADTELAQERVLAVWTRLIRPDGASIALGSPASDDLGKAGFEGDVDTRFGERFGSAALISILSAIAGVAEGRLDEASGEDLDVDVAGDFDRSARTSLERYLTLRPVIRVHQGAKISVFVARDLVF